MNGKTALITGATGYLGRAMAYALAQAGACVFINSRSQEKCNKLIVEMRKEGLLVKPAVFNVSIKKEVDGFFSSFNNKPLHVLVNNAYAGGAGNITLSTADSYQKSYDVTILAAHYMLNAAMESLYIAYQQTGDASIINIASMYALVSPDQRIYDSSIAVNPPFYGAAKAALVQWTRYAACEFGVQGVRVNSLSPGPFPSPLVQKENPKLIKKIEQKVPLARIGNADEIKGPVLFLASPASSFVNGANIVVDGGWTCW